MDGARSVKSQDQIEHRDIEARVALARDSDSDASTLTPLSRHASGG